MIYSFNFHSVYSVYSSFCLLCLLFILFALHSVYSSFCLLFILFPLHSVYSSFCLLIILFTLFTLHSVYSSFCLLFLCSSCCLLFRSLQVMMALSAHLGSLEAEKQKLRAQVNLKIREIPVLPGVLSFLNVFWFEFHSSHRMTRLVQSLNLLFISPNSNHFSLFLLCLLSSHFHPSSSSFLSFYSLFLHSFLSTIILILLLALHHLLLLLLLLCVLHLLLRCVVSVRRTSG